MLYPTDIQRGLPAGHQRPSPTVEGPAQAHQRRPVEAENPPPRGARDTDVTLSWTSPSTRQSTPQEEKQAMNWMKKSGRGENKACTVVSLCSVFYPRIQNCRLQLNMVAPSGPDLNFFI